MNVYESVVRPLLFRTTDPEWIHHVAMKMLQIPWVASLAGGGTVVDPVEVCGLRFRNRIGLAAGFDKNAEALSAWYALGFGFAEVGTITLHAQPGNPRPRIFRCPDEKGLVNRMGFPNLGASELAKRLHHIRHLEASQWRAFPIGINLGKSKKASLDEAASDYLGALELLYDTGDFFVVNVSSPNTPGLRQLQDRDRLIPILQCLAQANREKRNKPLFLKIAPDVTEAQLDDILQILNDTGFSGIVATNTTLDHSKIKLRETGGLSGLPVREKSTQIIRRIAQITGGKLPIIGVGGVFTREDYLEKLEAGASLVQVYTGFIYQGPRIVRQLLL